jgi:hypothetical protein
MTNQKYTRENIFKLNFSDSIFFRPCKYFFRIRDFDQQGIYIAGYMDIENYDIFNNVYGEIVNNDTCHIKNSLIHHNGFDDLQLEGGIINWSRLFNINCVVTKNTSYSLLGGVCYIKKFQVIN